MLLWPLPKMSIETERLLRMTDKRLAEEDQSQSPMWNKQAFRHYYDVMSAKDTVMTEFVHIWPLSDRTARLLMCAWVRLGLAHYFHKDGFITAREAFLLQGAEAMAEGIQRTPEEWYRLLKRNNMMLDITSGDPLSLLWMSVHPEYVVSLEAISKKAYSNADNRTVLHDKMSLTAWHVFGTGCNFHPDFKTNTNVAMARQMYEANDFSAMPILADALQECGADQYMSDYLSDMRDPNVRFFKGNWVTDSLLEKS